MGPRSQSPDDRQPDYENPEKVRTLFDRCVDDAKRNTARLLRDKQDLLNLLFDRGGPDNQWVVWDNNTDTYRTRPYDDSEFGMASWIPRATSNLFANWISGITSLLNQSSPAKQFKPATDDDRDLAAAQVCEDALPVLEEEIDYDRLRRQIHRAITLTDKVLVCYYYDNDPKYGTQPIPAMQCQNPECPDVLSGEGGIYTPMELEENDGACPACGSTDFAEVIDPSTGIPVGVDYPTGKICAEMFTSYEFSGPRDVTTTDTHTWPWFMTHAQVEPTVAARYWPEHEDLFRERGGSNRARLSGQQAEYARHMRRLSSPQSAQRWGGDDGMGGPIIYRLQHDPISDKEVHFPDGLYAVMCGETILESGPLPFKNSQQQPQKSGLVRTFQENPGTIFGKPPADDLVWIQERHNQTETMLMMILMHNAAPNWVIPDTVTLTDAPSGIPGEPMRYRSHDGQRPYMERGQNPPEGLYKYLELLQSTGDKISGLNSVLQGATPSGDPTLGEVQILQERGMAAFKTPLENLISFEKDQARLLIDIARTSAWSPRFRQVMGENRQWEVEQFSGADLTGRVDVVIEPSTAWPRSMLMQRLSLQEAAKMGAIMPPQDPELQTKLLTMLDLTELKPSLDVDTKQIARKLDRWKAARMPQEITPPRKEVDNLPLHLFFCQQFLKTEEAEALAALNPAVYQAMLMHVQQIQMLMQPPQPPAPPAPPDDRTPVEKGDESAVQGAIDSGVLVPEGAEGPPVEAAVQTGVLTPEPPMPQAPGAGGQQMSAPPAPAGGPSVDDFLAMQRSIPIDQDATPAPPGGGG